MGNPISKENIDIWNKGKEKQGGQKQYLGECKAQINELYGTG